MKQTRFLGLFFLTVLFLTVAGCTAATTGEALPAPESFAKTSTPILSTALDRDCEFREPTGDKLEVGDLAVDFTLRDVYGDVYILSELLQEKPVILIFGSYT